MSCGDGKRMRSRTCRGSAAECVGDATQEQSCKERECEIPCWAEWAEWTTCSKSCGTGIQERRRDKVNYPIISARFTMSFRIRIDHQLHTVSVRTMKLLLVPPSHVLTLHHFSLSLVAEDNTCKRDQLLMSIPRPRQERCQNDRQSWPCIVVKH